MSGAGPARRSASDSLLRISQACETMLAGFNSGKAVAVRSCLVSRKRAVSVSEQRPPTQEAQDRLLPLEDTMSRRRARPSLLLPAWRAVGFAVGTGTTALLPQDVSARVGTAIATAVNDRYDDNIRFMYESGIAEEEKEVKDLFKTQRDELATAPPQETATKTSDNSEMARAMALEGTMKSVLRAACDVTAKV